MAKNVSFKVQDYLKSKCLRAIQILSRKSGQFYKTLGSNPCPIGLYNSNAKQINACINILISLFYVCKYNTFLIIMNPRSSDRNFDQCFSHSFLQ